MDSFIAVFSNYNIINNKNNKTPGFIAFVEESGLLIKVSTGRFSEKKVIDFDSNSLDTKIIQDALNYKKIKISDMKTVIPLCIGDESLGVIYLEHRIDLKQDLELLHVFANQAAVAIQNARLYEMATMDPLTGLYVRRFFVQCLHRELRSALRSNNPLSLIMLDLDAFKKINDTHGHLIGDKVLSEIGKILKNSTRSSDFACRYGGDEFTILLTNTSIGKSKIVVNRILKQVKSAMIKTLKGDISIKVSVGVSGTEPPKFSNNNIPHPIPNIYFEKFSEKLIKSSDSMMYDAKKDTDNSAHYHKEIKWPKYD
jgi:diguanylate cyclase (GGDEF)-like protein